MADKLKCHHCGQEIINVDDAKDEASVDDYGFPDYKFFHKDCYVRWKHGNNNFEPDWYS